MRRGLIAVGLAFLALTLVPGVAGAEPQKGTVEGAVLDTTCAAGCEAECPPPPVCRGPQACTASRIVCPLTQRQAPRVCTQAGCPGPPIVRYPRYEGTDASVILRRAGSAQVLRKVPVSAGAFGLRLAPGRYVLRAHVAEPCWTGTKQVVEIDAGETLPVVLKVNDGCVMHPDARR